MTPGPTRCSSSRPGSPPRRVSARAGLPLRTKRSMRSTSAIARSTRSSAATDVGAGGPPLPAPLDGCSSFPWNGPVARAPRVGCGIDVVIGEGSPLASGPARSAAWRSSAARPSSRVDACSVATTPSATRCRAEASISTRACARAVATVHAPLRPSIVTPRFAVAAARRGMDARPTGRGVRARSDSSNLLRGGTGGRSLLDGGTGSDSIVRWWQTKFVPTPQVREGATRAILRAGRPSHPGASHRVDRQHRAGGARRRPRGRCACHFAPFWRTGAARTRGWEGQLDAVGCLAE